MLRARAYLLALVLALTGHLLAKDQSGMVMLWPNPDHATLKLTFSSFRSLGSFGGQMTLISEVIIENLSSQVMPQASFSVFLLDKDRVRIGNGLLVVSDLNPGESAKVQFQCESVGPPVTLSLAAKNNAGVPSSLKTIPLQVISVPPGASLKVDGKDQGFTPATINLSVGTHNLELQKEGFALTTTPVDVAASDMPNGSIKINLGGLSNDVVQLRDGSSLNGDVLSLSLDSIVIMVEGKEQKLDRNQVRKIFLVERTVVHPPAPDTQTKTKAPTSAAQTPHR